MPKSDRGRFSAKRKREAVLRLLRGEDLDLVSRELERKLGQVTMDNELLYEKIDKMEAGVPLGRRRSKR